MTPATLAGTVALFAGLATFGLVMFKVTRGIVLRSRRKRQRDYTNTIADVLTTGVWSRRLHRLSGDGVLLDVVHDFLGVVAGHERARLDALIGHLGIRERLRRRIGHSPFLGRRLEALHLLSEIATPADEALLLGILDSRSASLRFGAARGLVRLGSRPGLDRILDAVVRSEPGAAVLLADALVGYGPVAVDPICRRLLEQQGVPSPLLLRVLGLIGDREAAGVVASFLADPDPEVRVAAVSALGRAGTAESVALVGATSGDADWRVRARAAASLGDLGDPAAIPTLRGLLRDSSWWVRQNSATALAKLPDGPCALVAALDDADRFAADAARERLELSFPELAPAVEVSP